MIPSSVSRLSRLFLAFLLRLLIAMQNLQIIPVHSAHGVKINCRQSTVSAWVGDVGSDAATIHRPLGFVLSFVIPARPLILGSQERCSKL